MKKRTLWIGIGIVVVGAATVVGLMTYSNAVPVETATITRGTLREMVTEEGMTRAQNRFTIAAPISGRLERIGLSPGDAIEKGDTLARILPAPQSPLSIRQAEAQVAAAEARRDEAQARVAEARSQATQANREAERTQTLQGRGTVSGEAAEQAALAAESAEQQVEAAQAGLRAALADLTAAQAALASANAEDAETEAMEIGAPEAGTVLQVLEKNERVIQAGTPLLEFGDTRNLEVVIGVLSADAVRINPGDPLIIAEWGGQGTLEGEVTLVEPDAYSEVSALGVQERRVDVVGRLTDTPAELGAGFRVEASIVTWQGDNVLTVPTSALFQRGGDWQVFTLEDGEARLTAVEIGHRSPDAAEVTGGLEEEDRVILYPTDQIADGVAVEPRE